MEHFGSKANTLQLLFKVSFVHLIVLLLKGKIIKSYGQIHCYTLQIKGNNKHGLTKCLTSFTFYLE